MVILYSLILVIVVVAVVYYIISKEKRTGVDSDFDWTTIHLNVELDWLAGYQS